MSRAFAREREGEKVPVVSRFFGIVIAIYWRDHSPPHFHAKYGEQEVTIDIQTGDVNGMTSKRVLAMVEEWRVQRKDALLDDWNRAATKQPLVPIEPLE